MKRALISVSDKTGIVELAKEISALGYEILSTGGTAKTLENAGVAVTSVSDVTGLPRVPGRPGEDAASSHPWRPAGHARQSGAYAAD